MLKILGVWGCSPLPQQMPLTKANLPLDAVVRSSINTVVGSEAVMLNISDVVTGTTTSGPAVELHRTPVKSSVQL